MTKKQVSLAEIATAHLRAHDFKVTEQRVAVLSLLMKVHKPVTIDAVSKALPEINYVTLYRMLKQFVDAGLVYQTDFRAGKAYFEFQEHHHHHVVCTSCGTQEAVDACLPDQFLKHVATHTSGFATIQNHTLEFFGICNACKK